MKFLTLPLSNRMIRRAPGLKLVVQTLLYSLKPIGNTVLIAAIFFVMFGILGVQVTVLHVPIIQQSSLLLLGRIPVKVSEETAVILG